MRSIVNILFLVLSVSICGQETIGISNSNYAGTNGIGLNPSSIVDSRVFIDVNIIGASVFVENDYVYFPKEEYRPSNAYRGYFPDLRDNFSSLSEKNQAIVDVNVPLLAAMVSLGEHSVGFHTGVRSQTNVNKIPQHLAKFIKEGFDYLPQRLQRYNGERFNVSSSAWAEIGVSYGYLFHKRNYDLWSAGITIKRLYGLGHTAFYFDEFSYEVPDTNDITIYDLRGKYAIAEPAWKAGKGWGVDLGVTYKKAKVGVNNYIPHSFRGKCRIADYYYKIGVSLLDVGSVKYDQNSTYAEFEVNNDLWEDYPGTSVNGIENIEDVFDDQFPSTITTSSNSFKSKLPTAVSAQFDYNFGYKLYGNATIVQRFARRTTVGTQRANMLALTARYERQRFEAALPIVFYEYKHPHVGLMLRLNSIIIGSDNILPFLFRQNVYGADFYFNLKYTMFRNPKCRKAEDKRSVDECVF